MKRVFALVVSVFMALSLVACGNDENKVAQKEVFDVKITLPAELMVDVDQDDLDEAIEEGDFHAVEINEDGSVTFTMSKKQHRELMNELKEEIDEELLDMVEDDDYPNIIKIEHNDNFTKFTTTTRSVELDFMESFTEIAYYMYGAMYNYFDGNEEYIIEVEYINADSGEVIYKSDSSTLDEETE